MRRSRKAFTSFRVGVGLSAVLLAMLAGCQRESLDEDWIVHEVTVDRTGLRERDGDAPPVINAATGGWSDVIRAARAEKEKTPTYIVRAWPGAVLMVNLPGGWNGRSKREAVFAMEYRDIDRGSLRFATAEPVVRLNGEEVALFLDRDSGHEWLSRQPDEQLASIRTLRLGGDGSRDAAALRRFEGRQALVHMDRKYAGLQREDVREALVAIRPRGLVARLPLDLYPMLERMDRLEFLMLDGRTVPPASSVPALRMLVLEQVRSEEEFESSIGELAKMNRLRAICLGRKRMKFDPARLGRLDRLWSLALSDSDKLTDLSPLADCGNLRFLTLLEADNLTDISHLNRMRKLVELTISDVPDDLEDLSPIAELPDLRWLAVDSTVLDKREKEFKALRQANDKLEIVGFCMGSAWILAIVPLAALGAVFLRRRTGRRS